MKDILDNKDVLRTGEKPLSPEAARWDVLEHAIGNGTVSMAPLGVLNQELEPMVGAQVDQMFAERQRQQNGVERPIQPVAPIETVVEMDNDEYLDRLAREPAPVHTTEISPAARTAVMESTVDFSNGFQEAA